MHNIGLETAKARIKEMYDEIGETRKEWYDIKYWFERFGLGDYQQLLQDCCHRVSYYPETQQVLANLSRTHTLIASSGSSREFLTYLLAGVDRYFSRVFSSISDYSQPKTPQFYANVCQEMDVRPSEIVHVGDSWQFDVLSAGEAGITAYHIDRNQEKKGAKSLRSLRELESRLR